MKNKNLAILMSLGYLFYGGKNKKEEIINIDKEEEIRNIDKEEEIINIDKEEEIRNIDKEEEIRNIYEYLSDYEYYKEYLLAYEKKDNIIIFELNQDKIFKLILNKDNIFFIEIGNNFIVKKIKLNLIKHNDNIYTLNFHYKFNILEKIFINVNFNFVNIDFKLKIQEDDIEIKILNINQLENFFNLLEKYNFEYYEFVTRKNYILNFNKKKF